MATQAAKLGKKCNGCGVWNRPHAVGSAFDPGQKCFMDNCKCILYQGMAKDKYPGKHHRPSEPKGNRAFGTSSVEGAGTALRNTRQPVVPAVGAHHVPNTSSPWGATKYNKMLKDMETLKRENELLKSKGSENVQESGEEEPDNSKLVEARQALRSAEQKLHLAKSNKDPDQEEVDLFERKVKQRAAEVETLKQAIDENKPADMLYKEATNHQKQLKAELDRRQQTMQASRDALELAQKKFQEDERIFKETEERHQQAQQKAQTAAAKVAKTEVATGPENIKANVLGAMQASLPGLALMPQGSMLQKELEAVLDKWQVEAAKAYQQHQQQQKQQPPQPQATNTKEGTEGKDIGAAGAEPGDLDGKLDDDVEMDDKECDEHIQDMLGEEAFAKLAPDELLVKRNKQRGLVKAAALKTKKSKK